MQQRARCFTSTPTRSVVGRYTPVRRLPRCRSLPRMLRSREETWGSCREGLEELFTPFRPVAGVFVGKRRAMPPGACRAQRDGGGRYRRHLPPGTTQGSGKRAGDASSWVDRKLVIRRNESFYCTYHIFVYTRVPTCCPWIAAFLQGN